MAITLKLTSGEKVTGGTIQEVQKKKAAIESEKATTLRKRSGGGETLSRGEQFFLETQTRDESKQAQAEIAAIQEQEKKGAISKDAAVRAIEQQTVLLQAKQQGASPTTLQSIKEGRYEIDEESGEILVYEEGVPPSTEQPQSIYSHPSLMPVEQRADTGSILYTGAAPAQPQQPPPTFRDALGLGVSDVSGGGEKVFNYFPDPFRTGIKVGGTTLEYDIEGLKKQKTATKEQVMSAAATGEFSKLGYAGTMRETTDAELREPRSFFGIKEPQFIKKGAAAVVKAGVPDSVWSDTQIDEYFDRKWGARAEYESDKAAGTKEFSKIQSNIGAGKELWKQQALNLNLDVGASLTYAKGIPLKAIRRPITTTVAVGAFALTKGGAGAYSGGLIGSGATTLGLTTTGLTVSSVAEERAGGTGSRTFGTAIFIGAAALTGFGLKKIKGRYLDAKTDITYKLEGTQVVKYKGTNIVSKLKESPVKITGKTAKGSTYQGKPYKETFTSVGGQTERTIILYSTSKLGRSTFFKSFNTFQGSKRITMKVTEFGGQQFTKTYVTQLQGGDRALTTKLVGTDFKYIDPSQNIALNLQPLFKSRTTESEVESAFRKRKVVSELYSGKQYVRGKGYSGKLKLEDRATRQVDVHSPKITKVTIYEGTKKPFKFRELQDSKIVFGKDKPLVEDDVHIISYKPQSVVVTQIKQPRVTDVGEITRTLTGELHIKGEKFTIASFMPSIDLNLKKKGGLTLTSSRVTTSVTPESVVSGSGKLEVISDTKLDTGSSYVYPQGYQPTGVAGGLSVFTGTGAGTSFTPLFDTSSLTGTGLFTQAKTGGKTKTTQLPISEVKVPQIKLPFVKAETRVGQVQVPDVTIIPQQDEQLITETKISQVLVPVTPITPTIFPDYRVPEPRIPRVPTPIIPPPIPLLFGFGMQKGKKGKKGLGGKKSLLKFRPSLGGIQLGKRHKGRRKDLTGFEVRGLF